MGVRGEIFSNRVILPNRTYFFNVKENRMGDLYLNIVESKNRETGGFDRQSVILFADDLQEFLKGFDESLRVMEKAVREKKKPGGENRKRSDDKDGRQEQYKNFNDDGDRRPKQRQNFNNSKGGGNPNQRHGFNRENERPNQRRSFGNVNERSKQRQTFNGGKTGGGKDRRFDKSKPAGNNRHDHKPEKGRRVVVKKQEW